jgi:delta 1-pyrroline-5-carboxylate dehydrogenase
VTQELTNTRELARADIHNRAKLVGNDLAAARGDARAAVEAAERAFPSWSATPAAERGGLLQRAS